MKTQNRATARGRFMVHLARIDAALAKIQAARADHFGTAPDTVDWSDVGSLEETAKRLESVAEWAAGP